MLVHIFLEFGKTLVKQAILAQTASYKFPTSELLLTEISREHLNPLEMEISDTLREVANDIDERVG